MGKRNSRRSKRRTCPGIGSSVAEKSKSSTKEEAFSITSLMAHPHVEVEVEVEVDQDQPWPCLLICHGKEKKPILTFYNVSGLQYHSRVAQECINKCVYWSHGEWLLLWDATDSSDCCILNALTMEKLQLPPLPPIVGEHPRKQYFSHYGSFILSSSSSSDCGRRVFLINGLREFSLSWEMGEKQFSRQELHLGEEMLLEAIIFQGKMYCITFPSKTLFCSELEDSSAQQNVKIGFREFINGETLKDLFLFECNSNRRCYLIESCGQLLYVDQFELGTGALDFLVFRADLIGKTWERVNNIGGDRAIFIDDWRGFSASIAGCGLQGNCIYFPDVDGTLYVYDFEDNSVTMSSPFPFDTKESEMRWLLV